MAIYLGIDTSNYTTSVAAFDTQTGQIVHRKKLLPVAQGTLGLKQSDAVFAHVKQLPQLLEELFFALPENQLAAVGVSVRPRDQEDSYMPCFLTGKLAASAISSANHIPMYGFSHQCGHIVAALYSAKRLDLIGQEFVAFHFSGGTTECVHVERGEDEVLSVNILYHSLDLKCGQAIDRVGTMMGLSFPAGRELDALSRNADRRFPIKTTFKDGNCCVSGLQNQCEKLWKQGESRENIARFCIDSVCKIVEQMAQNAQAQYPGLPLIFSGGVMSNSLIREKIAKEYHGYFAEPEFSADNAAGIAILAAIQDGVDLHE